jgi:hypothetical protein
MHEQSARRFMQVAERYGKSNTMLDLTPTALYELAAPSTPPEVQAEVERRIAAGEIVSAGTTNPTVPLDWRQHEHTDIP